MNLKEYIEEEVKSFQEFTKVEAFDGHFSSTKEYDVNELENLINGALTRIAEATRKAGRVERVGDVYADGDASKATLPRVAEMLGRQAGYNNAISQHEEQMDKFFE